MRILLVVDGPSSHLFPLPFGWADRGHDVDILLENVDGRFGHASQHLHPGVRLLTLAGNHSIVDAVSGVRTGVSLSAVLASAEAVVIGGYSTHVARRVLRATVRTPTRRVLLSERPEPRASGLRRLLRGAVARWALSRVDAVWSMSEAGDQFFAHLGMRPEARVPYPMQSVVRSESILAERVAKTWRDGGPRQLVFVGKFISRKRPHIAVEVVRLLSERNLKVAADFAGDGDLENELRMLARELPITFHGHVPASAVSHMLATSNLLLHPAAHDGWGMAVVEAASRGVPVVATTGCDAATELAAKTSWVRVTDGSPGAMAQAVEELVNAFSEDPMGNSKSLIQAVEEVCGADRVVERSLAALSRAHRGKSGH